MRRHRRERTEAKRGMERKGERTAPNEVNSSCTSAMQAEQNKGFSSQGKRKRQAGTVPAAPKRQKDLSRKQRRRLGGSLQAALYLVQSGVGGLCLVGRRRSVEICRAGWTPPNGGGGGRGCPPPLLIKACGMCIGGSCSWGSGVPRPGTRECSRESGSRASSQRGSRRPRGAR